MRWRTILPWIAGGMVVCLWALWATFVYYQGTGHGPFDASENKISFELAGQLGDAFGAFSALMSALAVLGVILSLRQSQISEERKTFDSNFYTLLGHFQQITNSVDVHKRRSKHKGKHRETLELTVLATGRDALRYFLEVLHRKIDDELNFNNSVLIHRAYSEFYDKWSDDLGHYFRMLYSIFRLIEYSCPDDKQAYARIVRAHLSQSELRLLAYNCIVGEGYDKFRIYVEKFAVLHNLSEGVTEFLASERRFFERWLSPSAFGEKSSTVFTYRDPVTRESPNI